MDRKILKIKILAISFIFLFISISDFSVKSIYTKSTKSYGESIEDCRCKIKTDNKICNLLWNRFSTLRAKANITYKLMIKFFYHTKIYRLLDVYFRILCYRATPIIILGELLKCDWIPSLGVIKSKR